MSAPPLRIAEPVTCSGAAHPHACANIGNRRVPVVYQWTYMDDAELVPDHPEHQLVSWFLASHGITPAAWVAGNQLEVRVRCDGTLWLHTWRVVGNEAVRAVRCPYCPSCLQQEEVVVPLVAPVPLVGNAYLAPEVSVPTRLPDRVGEGGR